MVIQPPSIQEQRDNLQIGVYLATHPHGVGMEQVVEVVLGYDPQDPVHPYDFYERRFRKAQAVGRNKLKARTPGYFTFNAVQFGRIYLYKALWYVWTNPGTGESQTVPLVTGDLAPMRRARDKDLATRQNTARSIRAASDIEEQRQAIQRGDYRSLQAIHERMADDEALGKILTGLHGIPYAEIQEILPQLPDQTFGNLTLSFQQTAREIKRYQRRLRQAQARVSRDELGDDPDRLACLATLRNWRCRTRQTGLAAWVRREEAYDYDHRQIGADAHRLLVWAYR